ncbi:hypothetical protein HZ326_0850 [Fusarium oxysporum f. sp. albedinis]|nr:hypothetical protein HZ326_0850 [Fusarium oxysporum f. sp. albedinis]
MCALQAENKRARAGADERSGTSPNVVSSPLPDLSRGLPRSGQHGVVVHDCASREVRACVLIKLPMGRHCSRCTTLQADVGSEAHRDLSFN